MKPSAGARRVADFVNARAFQRAQDNYAAAADPTQCCVCGRPALRKAFGLGYCAKHTGRASVVLAVKIAQSGRVSRNTSLDLHAKSEPAGWRWRKARRVVR